MQASMNRRMALASIGLAGLAATSAAGQNQPAQLAKWGNLELHPPEVIGPKTFSTMAGDNSLGVIFDSLTLALGQTDKARSAVKAATLAPAVTIPENRAFVGYVQIIRGLVEKSNGARIVLTADIAGSCQVFEFPYGQSLEQQDYERSFFSLEMRSPKGDALEYPPIPPYTINLLPSICSWPCNAGPRRRRPT